MTVSATPDRADNPWWSGRPLPLTMPCSDPPSSGNAIAGHRTRTAHIESAESRCRVDNDHSTSAQVGHPIIASVIYVPNTVRDRNMS
jgi:hypothetical protein